MDVILPVADASFGSTCVARGARLSRLVTGLTWAEGPAYSAAERALYFSDVDGDTLHRWSASQGDSVVRSPSRFANGNTIDLEGRLVTCEQGPRRVVRADGDGEVAVLADRFDGQRLNSPNDVVVRSDGTVWFTDPDYGIISDAQGSVADPELDGCYVFRLDPGSGELDVVATDLQKPNGLAFSTDESVLYVTDSAVTHDRDGAHHIRAYDVVDGRWLADSRVLREISPGWPDGLRVDVEDRIWAAAGDGVHCLAPDGTLLGKILVPETVANCEFGGPSGDQLFITATSSLYVITLVAGGALMR